MPISRLSQPAIDACFTAFVVVLLGTWPLAAQSAGQTKPAAEIRYELPETNDAEELTEYLTALLTYQPDTDEAAEQYLREGPAAMARAAQQILDLEHDTNSESYLLAQKYLLALDVMSIDQATPAERAELMQLVATNLKHPQMDADDLDIAIAFAEGLEASGKAAAAAVAYEEFGRLLIDNNDTLIADLGELMIGSARRLNSLGQPVKVEGTTLEGRPFDWNAYRGKVVLIDFWATWCEPCRTEMPNIQKYYEAYRELGFEVVSISMDDDRAALEEYLKSNPVQWTTLFEEGNNDNPTAKYYGISDLPSTMLVDQRGRVVSLTARGEELGKLLQQLLGAP